MTPAFWQEKAHAQIDLNKKQINKQKQLYEGNRFTFLL